MPNPEVHSVVGYIRGLVDPPGRNGDDARLLERFAADRDQGAFAILVRRHGLLVWRACRHVLDQQDAEDVFQATFLTLARKAGSIRRKESVGPWLFGVARRLAMNLR